MVKGVSGAREIGTVPVMKTMDMSLGGKSEGKASVFLEV